MTTKAEKKRNGLLSELGCALCFRIHGPHKPGPVQLHHLRGGGWGRGGPETQMPLCWNHHDGPEGIHHVGTKLWEREFGVTQRELLAWTLARVPA